MATRGALIIAALLVAGLLFSGCASAQPSPAPSSSSDEPENQTPDFFVTFLLLLIACFAAYVYYVFIVSVMCSAINFEDVGIGPDELEKIPERLYATEVKDLLTSRRAVECAVCLCEFEDLERLRLLPGCGHPFHRDCIDTWLASNVTCPFCRGNIVDALKPSENEGDCVVAVDSNSSEPRHEEAVLVVVDPALVEAEEEEEEGVRLLSGLGRRMQRQSWLRLVFGQRQRELPCRRSMA